MTQSKDATPVVWRDEYSIGDTELDGHHKQLIRYIHVLEDPATRRGDGDFIAMMVDGLADYAGYHFAAEERRMEASGYPQLEKHRREHADFAKDVAIFRRAFGEGSPRLEKALLGYLKDWLLTHILTSDHVMGQWLAEHPVASEDADRPDRQ